MGAAPNPQHSHSSIMGFSTPLNQKERRLKAAHLLEAVIAETVEPRLAINRWPEIQEAPDPSLDCAYIALWHFEADEVQQQTEVFYMDAQLELLRQIADHLKVDRDLPPYILRTYLPASPVRFFYARSIWNDTVYQIAHFWHHVRRIFRQAFQLLSPR